MCKCSNVLIVLLLSVLRCAEREPKRDHCTALRKTTNSLLVEINNQLVSASVMETVNNWLAGDQDQNVGMISPNFVLLRYFTSTVISKALGNFVVHHVNMLTHFLGYTLQVYKII